MSWKEKNNCTCISPLPPLTISERIRIYISLSFYLPLFLLFTVYVYFPPQIHLYTNNRHVKRDILESLFLFLWNTEKREKSLRWISEIQLY